MCVFFCISKIGYFVLMFKIIFVCNDSKTSGNKIGYIGEQALSMSLQQFTTLNSLKLDQ